MANKSTRSLNSRFLAKLGRVRSGRQIIDPVMRDITYAEANRAVVFRKPIAETGSSHPA